MTGELQHEPAKPGRCPGCGAEVCAAGYECGRCVARRNRERKVLNLRYSLKEALSGLGAADTLTVIAGVLFSQAVWLQAVHGAEDRARAEAASAELYSIAAAPPAELRLDRTRIREAAPKLLLAAQHAIPRLEAEGLTTIELQNAVDCALGVVRQQGAAA